MHAEKASEIARVGKVACKPCHTNILDQLARLKIVLGKIEKGAKSTSENLEVEKKDLSNSAVARLVAIYLGNTTLPFYDPVLQLNSNPMFLWSGPQRRANLYDTILHELSHKYGTPDDNSKGELLNAEGISYLYSIDVTRWMAYKVLIDECDKSLMPPRSRPGGATP